jgi:uncharacterized membrane protein YfcA
LLMTVDIVTIVLLVIVGLAVSIFTSMIGGMGGPVYIPLLIFGFDFDIHTAIPLSLATMIPTAAFGSWGHYKRGDIFIRGGLFIAAFAFLGVAVGTYLSTVIAEKPLELFFGIVLILFTYPLYLERSSRQEKQFETAAENDPIETLAHPFAVDIVKEVELGVLGLASGLTAGLFGVSGAATLVVGMFLMGVSAEVVAGTSLFVLLFKAIFGFGWHATIGAHFPLEVAVALVLGTTVGANFGPRLLDSLGDQVEPVLGLLILVLDFLLGVIMITSGAGLLSI